MTLDTAIRLRQWLGWLLWGKRRFKRDEYIRRLANEEIVNFYLWAVIHDGISVPLDKSYQRWDQMTTKAKELVTRR